MARSIVCTVTLCFVLLVAWADDRALLAEEEERRWNTPPELIPEQVSKKSNAKSGRSLIIPITANVNLNAGNSAYASGFQVGPDGVSYSESNSFSHALPQANGAISQSQSVSFAAGLTGIAGAVAQASGQHDFINNNQGNANNQAFGFGDVTASASGTVGNGHITSNAASSSGSIHSSASSNIGNSGHATVNVKFPGQSQRQPIWTNIRPNHNNNGYYPSQLPKLEISVNQQSKQNQDPITLHVSTHPTRWENRQPTIRVHKWQPSYRSYYDDVPT